MAYSQKLKEHAKQLGHDVRIALVGAGQMGRGFGNQVSIPTASPNYLRTLALMM
jgi:predicted homoserine dehydrogenase-like protein